jgi:hypothetical protein
MFATPGVGRGHLLARLHEGVQRGRAKSGEPKKTIRTSRV